MKRFLISILILALTAGLLAGCNAFEGGTTEPMENIAQGEDSQKAEPTDKETAEETFVAPTGYPYTGKVFVVLLFHDDVLYTGERYLKSLPEDAVLIGTISSVDNDIIPDKEMAATQLPLGMKIYSTGEEEVLYGKYDDRQILKLVPYTGRLDIFLDSEEETEPSEETETLPPKLSNEVDPGQIFIISVYPNMDRDMIIDALLRGVDFEVLDSDYSFMDYKLGLLYDMIGEKTFYVYTEEVFDEIAGMNLMSGLVWTEGILGVERPRSYSDQRMSNFRYGPEMMQVGEVVKPSSGWSEFETLEEAETVFGCTFEIPENDLEKLYRIGYGYNSNVLEVIFLKDGEEVYRVRKGTGYGDPSGDTEHTHRVYYCDSAHGDLETFFRNDEGNDSFHTAYRSYTDYSYSVTAAETMTQEELLQLFTDDKHVRSEALDHPNSRDYTDYTPANWDKLEPVTTASEAEEVVSPTDDTGREAFHFPRQGEDGKDYAADTLIVTIDPEFDKEAVLTDLLAIFPVLTVKYDYKLAENVIAFMTTEVLSEDDLYELAKKVWAMTGVQDVSRDAINQLDVVHETTVLSDI